METVAVSISKSTSMDSSHHSYFLEYYPKSFTDISRVACTKIWSPIIWKEGKRCKANFLSAWAVALDFDEGFALDEAVGYLNFSKYKAFVALSKSHGLEKKTPGGKVLPACDRFRLVIMADGPICCLDQYEENLKHWRTILPADASCHDGGRFFFPSPKIWHIQRGRNYEWKDFKEQIAAAKIAAERRRLKYRQYFREVGEIPEKIKEVIVNGSAVGSRHKTCYWLGATLAEIGVDESTTVRLIMSGPLGDIGEEEVIEAVTYGRRKALGGGHERRE